MKKTLLVLCSLISIQLLKAQLQKIPLGLAPNQRFTLVKADTRPDGFVFIGRITTTIANNGYLDSLIEVNTDPALAVKSVNKFFLASNVSTTVDESLKAKYAGLFNKPNYTVGLSPQIKVSLSGGFKSLNNKFSVIPLTSTFQPATLSYDKRAGVAAETDLAPVLGRNIVEISNSSYKNATGHYFTIFDVYIDKGEDEGLQHRRNYLLKSNPAGTLDHIDSVDFPIKRYLYTKNALFNSKNEFKGIVYLFCVNTMTLKFKPSDSTDLQYNIVYVNEKGKIVYNKTFYFGDRKFDLEPMIVTERDGQLEMFTRSYNDSTRCLQFDAAGNLQHITGMPMVKKQIVKERSSLADFFSVQTYEPLYSFTDKNGETFYLIRQYKVNTNQLGVYENISTYGKFFYFKIKPDKSLVYLQAFADVSGVAPANGLPEVIALQSNGDFCDILLRNPQSNARVIWRLGDPKCPDIAPGIPAPAQFDFSAESIASINESEYYVAGYNSAEILVNKITMKLSK